MALEPVLIAGEWRQPANPTGSFKAIDPSTGKPLPESYPVSSIDDVTAAFRAADEAVVALRAIAGRRHRALPRRLRGAHRGAPPTRWSSAPRARPGLPATPRLRNVELPRTTNQLRQGAAAARERSWCAGDDRHQGEPALVLRAAGRPGRRVRAEQLPVRVQLGRGRRLRRRDRRRQPGHRQGEHRPPGHQQAARGAGARGGARRRAAAGDGAAALPDAARRRLRAGVRRRASARPASPAARAPASS